MAHICVEMGWPCATAIVLVSFAGAWIVVEWIRAINGVKIPRSGKPDGE